MTYTWGSFYVLIMAYQRPISVYIKFYFRLSLRHFKAYVLRTCDDSVAYAGYIHGVCTSFHSNLRHIIGRSSAEDTLDKKIKQQLKTKYRGWWENISSLTLYRGQKTPSRKTSRLP